MSVVEGGPNTAGIVARVQGILLKPQEEWAKIDTEAATTQGLLTYVAILAVIPAIMGLLVQLLFFHSIIGGVVSAVLGLALSVGAVWVEGFIINALASSFGATPNPMQALKAAAYANTPYFVAGIATIVPVLGQLVVIAGFLYGCYLLYLGLKPLMKAPDDKAVAYTIVAVVINIVVVAIAFMITAGVVGMLTVGSMMGAAALGR